MLKNKKQSLAKKAVYVDEDVYVDVYVDDDDDNIVVVVMVVMVMKRRMNARKNLRAKINDNDDKMITKSATGNKI